MLFTPLSKHGFNNFTTSSPANDQLALLKLNTAPLEREIVDHIDFKFLSSFSYILRRSM